MTILIVEDEAITAMFLAQSLKTMGHTIAAVTATGEEACKVVANNVLDIVLMDIALAGEMDGITAAQRIRIDQDVPIIFTSGYNTDDVRSRIRAVKNSAFLGKPLEPESLEALFQTMDETAPDPQA
jgi:two-component system, response regulator PdtaR